MKNSKTLKQIMKRFVNYSILTSSEKIHCRIDIFSQYNSSINILNAIQTQKQLNYRYNQSIITIKFKIIQNNDIFVV